VGDTGFEPVTSAV